MKNGIVSTYCERDSYGSIFQAMALRHVLLGLECESTILKLRQPGDPRKVEFKMPRSPGQCVIMANRVWNRKKIERRFTNTLDFMEQNVQIRQFESYEELKNTPLCADFYLAGSDQIWHPHLCNPMFFLDFVESGKRASYAASMGVTKIPEDKKQEFCRLLENISEISVREEENRQIIAPLVKKTVQVHIDPTFLCEPDFWKTKEKTYNIKKPYILVYPLYWEKNYNVQLKELHRKTGIPIVSVCNDWMPVYANCTLYDVDPGQFLWLIANAEAVVTSSFHGGALSTIYNKKVAIVKNPSSPSRLQQMQDTLGLKDIAIPDVMAMDTSVYAQVRQTINKEKERSLRYLKETLL